MKSRYIKATRPRKIVVLTGAGISAESGLRTFRDDKGLWENHRIEDVCTPEGFQRDPSLVHDFYNGRRQQLLKCAKPNAAHVALAEFEKRWPHDFLLVTQNVDNLHESAGSPHVLHMHGELLSVRCQQTRQSHPWRQDTQSTSLCPCCQQPGNIRPDIVWFGEMPKGMARIHAALEQADIFVAVGTSGHVYPAAGFVSMAKDAGAHTVELNLEPSDNCSQFHEQHYGLASQVVQAFFEAL